MNCISRRGCIIGIDGGGTKTMACVADITNATLRAAKTGGSYWRETGIDAVVSNLLGTVGGLVGGNLHNVAGIAMGLPCHGESAEGDAAMERALHGAFGSIPLYITNDVEVGWAGSLALSPGINVVAGTGAIAFGKDSCGASARSGGWSHFFSDEGSCYWIGRAVMGLFAKQSDGRMQRDELYHVVRAHFGLNDDFEFIDIMHNGYIGSRERVASLQLLAERAALAGSSSAKALYERAAAELGLLAAAVKARLNIGDGQPLAISYSGGLFKAGELILPLFADVIGKIGGKLVKPRFEPAGGALLLACQQYCPDMTGQVESLILEGYKNNG